MFKPISYTFTPTEPELYYDSTTRLYDVSTRTKVFCYDCREYRPTIEVEAEYSDVCYNWGCNKPIVNRYWVTDTHKIVTEEMIYDYIEVQWYCTTVDRIERIFHIELPEMFKERFKKYIEYKSNQHKFVF